MRTAIVLRTYIPVAIVVLVVLLAGKTGPFSAQPAETGHLSQPVAVEGAADAGWIG